MRILVTLQPQMYREALAVMLRQNRPDDEVLLAAPGAVDTDDLADLRPDLLLHNDNDGVPPEIFGDAARVEVLYTDSMDAKIVMDGRTWESEDMSVQELLQVADEVEDLISGKTLP